MFYCTAYNLQIGSDFLLPEMAAAGGGADVKIRLMRERPVRAGRSITWQPGRRIARFVFPGAGRFLVRGGNQILVRPEPPTDLPLLRLYIQGMMLAALLDQRGLFVLHASVIQIGDRAIAFVGPVGSGKSTMAAAFNARGYNVVADDNAAISHAGGHLEVLPAFPNLKVYPEIARVLGYSIADLRVMHASQIKQGKAVDGGFASAPLGLERIYVLDRQGPTTPVQLSPVAAVTELVRHSVPTRWTVAGDGAHLGKCARVAGAVKLFRGRTFSRLEEITEVVDRIEEHAAPLAASMVGSW